jgi:hypothetical protein
VADEADVGVYDQNVDTIDERWIQSDEQVRRRVGFI